MPEAIERFTPSLRTSALLISKELGGEEAVLKITQTLANQFRATANDLAAESFDREEDIHILRQAANELPLVARLLVRVAVDGNLFIDDDVVRLFIPDEFRDDVKNTSALLPIKDAITKALKLLDEHRGKSDEAQALTAAETTAKQKLIAFYSAATREFNKGNGQGASSPQTGP